LGAVHYEAGFDKLAGPAYLQPDVSITHAGQAHGKDLNDAWAIAIEVISESNTTREMAKLTLYSVMARTRPGACIATRSTSWSTSPTVRRAR
jgi:hypothetical protein